MCIFIPRTHVLYDRTDPSENARKGVYRTEMCLDIEQSYSRPITYVAKPTSRENHDFGKHDTAKRLAREVVEAYGDVLKEGDRVVALGNCEIIVGSPFIRIPITGGRCSPESVLEEFYEAYQEKRTKLADRPKETPQMQVDTPEIDPYLERDAREESGEAAEFDRHKD